MIDNKKNFHPNFYVRGDPYEVFLNHHVTKMSVFL